jgi:sugar lactone lactonase YvrE
MKNWICTILALALLALAATVTQAGPTNEIPAPRKVVGIVHGVDGQPGAGVSVQIVGFGPVKSDANGKFDLEWNPQPFGRNKPTTCVLVRDAEHNLAAAQDVDEDTGPLDLKLAPGLTLAGRAEFGGKPITNATATLIFFTGRSPRDRVGWGLNDLTRTNLGGRFEIPAIPPGRKYGIIVSAPGYGQKTIHDVDSSGHAGRQELDPVELKLADLKLAGQVLDADDKPVAGCDVFLSGNDQPDANMRTDPEGRFAFNQVCAGTARLRAENRNSYGHISAEGGDTNVVLRLVAFGVPVTQAGAQSIYTPYAFTNFAGLPGVTGANDGAARAARFSRPYAVAVDSAGNVYVADEMNEAIRKITPAGVVTTLAGAAGQTGNSDGTGSAARFDTPRGVAVDSGDNVYVADTFNDAIRKITPAGVVTTLAGSAGQIGSTDGLGSAARFNNPYGVAADSGGNLYVADTFNHTIRKITPAGVVTTLAGSAGQIGSTDGSGSAARFNNPSGAAVDSAGNVYVADSENYTIRKITPAGVVTTLAGGAGPDYRDGTGGAARLGFPRSLAVDGTGNVYVASQRGYSMIRKITPSGVVTTLAGMAAQPGIGDGTGSADGIGRAARFNDPCGVAVDSGGNLYVADTDNHRITKGSPTK